MDLSRFTEKVTTVEDSLEEIDALPERVREEAKKIFGDAINAGKGIQQALAEVKNYIAQKTFFESEQQYISTIIDRENQALTHCIQIREEVLEQADTQQFGAVGFEPVIKEVDNVHRRPLGSEPRTFSVKVGYILSNESFSIVGERLTDKIDYCKQQLYELGAYMQQYVMIDKEQFITPSAQGVQDADEAFIQHVQGMIDSVLQNLYDIAYRINALVSREEYARWGEQEDEHGCLPTATVEQSVQYRRHEARQDHRWSEFFDGTGPTNRSFPEDRVVLDDFLAPIPSYTNLSGGGNHESVMEELSALAAKVLEE